MEEAFTKGKEEQIEIEDWILNNNTQSFNDLSDEEDTSSEEEEEDKENASSRFSAEEVNTSLFKSGE